MFLLYIQLYFIGYLRKFLRFIGNYLGDISFYQIKITSKYFSCYLLKRYTYINPTSIQIIKYQKIQNLLFYVQPLDTEKL